MLFDFFSSSNGIFWEILVIINEEIVTYDVEFWLLSIILL
jgi:hypothetical protein